jgi:hypothetical protein
MGPLPSTWHTAEKTLIPGKQALLTTYFTDNTLHRQQIITGYCHWRGRKHQLFVSHLFTNQHLTGRYQVCTALLSPCGYPGLITNRLVFCWRDGVRLNPLILQPQMGVLYQRYAMVGYGGLVKCWQGKTEVLRERPTTQIPHELQWDWTGEFRVRKQHLTASAMAQSTNWLSNQQQNN